MSEQLSIKDASSLPSLDALQQIYLDSLSEKEKMAYNIAKSHLGSSFSLEKCNGFVEWKKKQTM